MMMNPEVLQHLVPDLASSTNLAGLLLRMLWLAWLLGGGGGGAAQKLADQAQQHAMAGEAPSAISYCSRHSGFHMFAKGNKLWRFISHVGCRCV